MSNKELLEGRSVLIGRPVADGRTLGSKVAQMGALPIYQPAMMISDTDDSEPSLSLLTTFIAQYDAAVFVSRNAVRYALERRPAYTWPSWMKIYAVGPATAKALEEGGFESVIYPENQADSEHLAQLILEANAQAADDEKLRVLIFAAPGGRSLLADLLEEHCDEVSWCYVYQRLLPTLFPVMPSLMEKYGDGLIVAAHSQQILSGLWQLCDFYDLTQKPLCVPSERIAEWAKTEGQQGPISVAKGASDEQMLEAIQRLVV